MIIPVVFPSAALFWLNYNPYFIPDSFSEKNRRLITLPADYPFNLTGAQAREISAIAGCPLPISVLSPSPALRYKNENYHSFTRSLYLPQNGFIEICDKIKLSDAVSAKILVASPELCFLEAANILNFYQLLLFGYELCGIYVYDNNSEYQQQSRDPITSADSIRRFLNEAVYTRGHRKALQTVKYLMDRSNSKMETFLAILARLPASLGGYALKIPQLNRMIKMSPEAKEALENRECYYDMVWDDEKVIMEYDNNLSHLSANQHTIDKRRTTAASLSGYKVISITKSDIASLYTLDRAFINIRKALGMRSINHLLKKYEDKRRELIRTFWTFRSNDIDTYPL